MKSQQEIEDELQKLYKGRKWREKNAHFADMGMVVDGKVVPSKQVRIEFEISVRRESGKKFPVSKVA